MNRRALPIRPLLAVVAVAAVAEFITPARADDDAFAKAVAAYNRGREVYLSGKYEQAIVEFDEAIRLNPDLAAAFAMRGACHMYLKKHKRGIEDASEAIRLDAGLPEAWYIRAACHRHQGALEEAIADYQQTAEVFAQSSEEPEKSIRWQLYSHVQVAECYAQMGHRNDAYNSLRPIYELFVELADDPSNRPGVPLLKEFEARLKATRKLIDEKTPLEPSEGAREFLEYLESQ